MAAPGSRRISIRESFPLSDWKALQPFFEAHYWPEVAIASRKYFSWQLGQEAGVANLVTAWDGDRIVGTLGYATHPTFWGNTESTAESAWLMAWMVHPDYRYGVGLALLKVVQRRCPILLGIGARRENESIFNRLGWSTYPSVPRYVSVFDAPRAEAFALPNASPAEIRSALFRPMVSSAPDRCRDWVEGDYAPEWGRYVPLRFGTVRSGEFLHWRYVTHPTYRFTLLTLGDPDRPAVCIYRIEQASGIADKVGRVIEFFHPSDDAGRRDGRSLLHAVQSRLADEGCAFADYVTSSTEYGATLLEAGWVMEPRDRQLLAVRLQPVERVPYYRFNVEYGVQPGMLRPTPDVMYVTRGDGDADRPTIIPRQPASAD